MFPITELRLAIPLGMTVWNLPWYSACFYAITGNMLIAFSIIRLLGPISGWLRTWISWNRFFNWLFARTRKKGYYIDTLKFWGLVLFVGIPLPGTGAWTGCVAAFIFGLHYKRSLIAIFLGLLLSATVVTILTILGKTFL